MPIVGNGDDVHIEYEIPKHIKELITLEFLKELRNQLFRIHGYSIDTFAEDSILFSPSTGGWCTSFSKACISTNSKELHNYWDSLEWYDSDIFDDELSNMLVENGLILGHLSEIIESQLGIKESELRECFICGKLHTVDMVIEAKEDDWDTYRCLHCNDIKNTSDGNENSTNYYRSCLDEIKNYKWE